MHLPQHEITFMAHNLKKFYRFWIYHHASKSVPNITMRVAFLDQESYKHLLRDLRAVMSRNITRTVMSKNLTLPGVSKHNYISIGIYNHPCNAQPKGCKPYPGGKPLPPSECNQHTGLPWGKHLTHSLMLTSPLSHSLTLTSLSLTH